MFILLGLILIAFILGAIPSGYIIGLLHGIDLRKHGSHNIGATNAKRVLGTKAGVLTLIADILKGALAASLPSLLFGAELPIEISYIVGGTAVYGHCYSPFLKFEGGKGVAAGLGVFATLAPQATGIAVIVFIITVAATRYVSLGSVLAAASLPISMSLLFRASTTAVPFAVTTLVVLLIIVRHRGNIARLRLGEEPKLGSLPTEKPPKEKLSE